MDTAPSAVDLALPPEFDVDVYRALYTDLAHLTDAQLAEHFSKFGADEGRRANGLVTRADFAALIPPEADALEIGPFHSPLLRGERTKYFDVMPQSALVERAHLIKMMNPSVPVIDYVSPEADLSMVDAEFDCLLSSHAIEHQPDLVTHLADVARCLRPGGRYFVLAPDKRFCFDHFIAPSTIADVLQAHHEKRKRHTLKSLIEHRVLVTHNYGGRHWAGEHGAYLENWEPRLISALDEFAKTGEAYIDVHAWYFEPATARMIFTILHRLKFTDLEVERLYPTRDGANEFWMVLRKTD